MAYFCKWIFFVGKLVTELKVDIGTVLVEISVVTYPRFIR
jgi:hypothetical protein